MASNAENLTAQRLRKKRIPTACGACRASKVRCNGGNPCTRCRSLKKVCNFTERPKDPYQEKIDALSDQVSTLKRQLDTNTSPHEPNPASINTTNSHSQYQAHPRNSTTTQYSISHPGPITTASSGPLRSHFSGSPGRLPDLISVGLLSAAQASHYFATFFAGCDHYVPVFDPAAHDTLASVRQRSPLLLAALCTVGCRVACGTDAHPWRLLNFHLGRMLGRVLSAPGPASLETVQALLVRACYSAERSLLVASATRLAMDMGLPGAYDELLARKAAGDGGSAELMRRARTWLHVLVLSHILHVDAGDMLPFTFTGDPRRARILLDDNPHATVLDRFLFAQVELNVLRAHIFTTLSERAAYQGDDGDDDDDMLSVVRDAKIDIALWHNDWERILCQMEPPVPAWILVNLGVQRCWATTMALCRAVRTAGVDNVDLMTPAQRSVLAMARGSLRLHLQTILAEPRSYLHNLRYAMDFVWAKCAFCYLLLLKLCVLLPEEEDGDVGLNEDLIACGAVLSRELSDASGAGITGIANSTARMYLQLLQTGTETFARALQGRQEQPGGQVGGSNQDADAAGYPKAADELDAFVPDQFVFEWDFPGLTLFSSSTTGIGWLDDILLGALNGGGDFYGFMAPAAEFGDTAGQ